MQNSSYFTAVAALLFTMANLAMSLTYWVDTVSCTGNKDLTATVKETLAIAARSKERLQSNSDEDYASVFNFIYKKEKSDEDTYNKVHNFMKGVSKATSSDLNSANIRIYCDQDGRFKQRVDPETKEKLGGFEDEENWIQYPTKYAFERTGCKATRNMQLYTFAQTYKTHMEGDPPQKQEPDRATVTMCDMSFYTDENNEKPRKGKLLGDIKPEKDLTKIKDFSIERLMYQTSKILLHEWGHTPPFNFKDIEGGYFWDGIQSLSTEDALKNCDSHAYFGQLALLADRGYTLPRPAPEGSADDVVEQANKDRKEGRLAKYENITKRSLRRRLGRLARLARRNLEHTSS